MENEVCIIKINDEEISEMYPDILSVEVEDDLQLASSFKIKFVIQLQKDGTWTYLDDERLALWNKVEIAAGFPDDVVDVMAGYITRLNPYCSSESPKCCYLEVQGMDGSVLMDREEKLKDWPNRKDSDIAREIFSDHGLTPEVEDTGVVHDEAVSTIIQRESDIKFLKRLARRNGYECFVKGNTSYFRKPILIGVSSQKVLAMHFGDETNLCSFQAEINALQPTIVEMSQIDRLTKEVRNVRVDTIGQRQLGEVSSKALLPTGIQPRRLYIRQNVVTSQQEMQTLCETLYDEAGWLMQGEGTIISSLYQNVLRTRELVTIKGVGKTYSGVYYVTQVRHVFDSKGYIQHFKVRKNALAPDGTEEFGSGGSLMSGVV